MPRQAALRGQGGTAVVQQAVWLGSNTVTCVVPGSSLSPAGNEPFSSSDTFGCWASGIVQRGIRSDVVAARPLIARRSSASGAEAAGRGECILFGRRTRSAELMAAGAGGVPTQGAGGC